MNLSPEVTIAIVAMCGTVITGILRFVPKRVNSNGSVRKDICKLIHTNLDKRLTGMDGKLSTIEKDIKEVLKKVKI